MGRRNMMLKNHWRSQYCCPLCLQSSDFLTFNFPGKWFNLITTAVLIPSELWHHRILLELQSLRRLQHPTPLSLPHPASPSTTSFSEDSQLRRLMIIFFPLSGGHITYSQILVGGKSIKYFFSLKLESKSVINEKNFKIEQRICLKILFSKIIFWFF